MIELQKVTLLHLSQRNLIRALSTAKTTSLSRFAKLISLTELVRARKGAKIPMLQELKFSKESAGELVFFLVAVWGMRRPPFCSLFEVCMFLELDGVPLKQAQIKFNY